MAGSVAGSVGGQSRVHVFVRTGPYKCNPANAHAVARSHSRPFQSRLHGHMSAHAHACTHAQRRTLLASPSAAAIERHRSGAGRYAEVAPGKELWITEIGTQDLNSQPEFPQRAFDAVVTTSVCKHVLWFCWCVRACVRAREGVYFCASTRIVLR